MKNQSLLKVGGIIGIILGALSCITIVGLLWGIPMIIGGVKFTKYADMNEEELHNYETSILGWSIFFLIFSVVVGVLGLLYYIGLTSGDIISKKPSPTEELEKLKKLYDDKAITNSPSLVPVLTDLRFASSLILAFT